MKKIINIKNKIIPAVIVLNFVLMPVAYAVCEKEMGVCRISDLNKVAKTEVIANKILPTSKKGTELYDSIQTPAQKSQKLGSVQQFIKSLLKPSK